MTTLLQYGRKIRVEVAGIVVEDLRISFDFKSNADELEQDSKVRIYNMKKENFQQIYDNYKNLPHGYIKVFAGYSHATGLIEIFAGTIAWLRQVGKDGSIITEIIVGDRVRDLDISGKYVQVNWKTPVSVRYAVRYLAEKMDVEPQGLNEIPYGAKLRPGYTIDEPPSNALRTILESVKYQKPGLHWYSDGETLSIADGPNPRSDIGTLVKTPTNGLIGVPEIEEDERLKVTMLLEPRLKLKGSIRFFQSKYINPEVNYTIDTISHIGDNWTGRFITRSECIPPDYVPLSRSGHRRPLSAEGQQKGSKHGGESGGNRGSS